MMRRHRTLLRSRPADQSETPRIITQNSHLEKVSPLNRGQDEPLGVVITMPLTAENLGANQIAISGWEFFAVKARGLSLTSVTLHLSTNLCRNFEAFDIDSWFRLPLSKPAAALPLTARLHNCLVAVGRMVHSGNGRHGGSRFKLSALKDLVFPVCSQGFSGRDDSLRLSCGSLVARRNECDVDMSRTFRKVVNWHLRAVGTKQFSGGCQRVSSTRLRN